MTVAEPFEPGAGRGSGARHGTEAAETLHLLMRLRARGVNDKNVLRAFEAVPRGFFAAAAYRDLALRDVALPTGCGQTLGAPSDLALALAALDLRKDHHVLDIGTGSGYAAAILAHLAEGVISIERFRTLAIEAARRLEGRGITNVRVLQGDALEEIPATGPFHRAFIDLAVDEPPAAVARRLVDGAICVFARPVDRMCHLLRAEKLEGGGWREELIGLTRVGPPIPGLSRYL
jgi:protein-L-isoaspartate(D-aspartate) O-methyltransferase